MKTLCGMSTDELASSHLKEERKRIRDESYAGHMRPEEEGNEIVYKDGALQKIDKVKSDAKKQGLTAAPASTAGTAGDKTLGNKGSKKARKGSGAGGGAGSSADGGGGGEEGRRTGAGAVGSRVKIELRGSGRDSGDSGDEDDDEEEGEASGGRSVGRGRRGSGASGPVELKRRLSSSSDVGKDGGGEGGEMSLTKRIKRLSAGSPMMDDVPK